jgi:RHS repeat-associated protein
MERGWAESDEACKPHSGTPEEEDDLRVVGDCPSECVAGHPSDAERRCRGRRSRDQSPRASRPEGPESIRRLEALHRPRSRIRIVIRIRGRRVLLAEALLRLNCVGPEGRHHYSRVKKRFAEAAAPLAIDWDGRFFRRPERDEEPGLVLETGTGTAYTYDEEGERTKLTPSEGPATTYKYDQAGDLSAVERSKEGETPAISENYTYDGTGLRASQTVSGTTSYLTWDESAGLPLILSDGQNSYIYGPGGLPTEQISSGETPTYLHRDQLGSTRMLTNPGGEATGKFTYNAYGKLEGHTGVATTPLGYAGQYTDEQSGLQYLRARVYDPATAQFLTKDSLASITGAPYGYVEEDPLRYIDPSGMCGVSVGHYGPIEYPDLSVGDCASKILESPATAPVVTTGGCILLPEACIPRIILGGALLGLASNLLRSEHESCFNLEQSEFGACWCSLLV